VAIGGKMARVYFILLKHGRPMGVREIQRLAGISSSGSTKYYLDRLVELGFAERRSGDYIVKVNKESLLSVYVGLLGSIVPRLIPYAVFSTALICVYAFLAEPPIDSIIVALTPTAFLWIEGVRLTRLIKKLLSSEETLSN